MQNNREHICHKTIVEDAAIILFDIMAHGLKLPFRIWYNEKI